MRLVKHCSYAHFQFLLPKVESSMARPRGWLGESGSSSVKRFAITVSGRVQGVGYRYFAVDHAEAADLTGWVHNCPNGDVELEVQGHGDSIRAFCDALWQGPPLSRVSHVSVSEISAQPGENSFAIEH
jgi:acylphosphatase